MVAKLEVIERRHGELESAARRLRAAAMSDPAKNDELADALVGLVGVRLLGWMHRQAALDAPESVVLAARILADRGASGPYASLGDAARYFTATAQLAAVQAALGQLEAAGRTLGALESWRAGLGSLPLASRLDDETVVWALVADARVRLTDDVAAANASTNAALRQLYAAELAGDAPPPYLVMAVQLLAADCRWASGQPAESLAHHRLALTGHREATAGVESARIRPAVSELVIAPAQSLFGTFGLRLEAIGDRAGALSLRRSWVAVVERYGGESHPAVAVARAELGWALRRAGREIEAEPELAVARQRGVQQSPEVPPPIARMESTFVAPVESPCGRPVTQAVLDRLQADVASALAAGGAARVEAERAEEQLRVAAERAAAEAAVARAVAEREDALRTEAAARQAAQDERRAAAAAAARQAAEEETARAAAEERRRQLAQERERARLVDAELFQAAVAQLPVVREQLAAVGSDLSARSLAHQRLASLLRPLAQVEPETYGAELVSALETLGSLRWRLGDYDGSREAAREAKLRAAELDR